LDEVVKELPSFVVREIGSVAIAALCGIAATWFCVVEKVIRLSSPGIWLLTSVLCALALVGLSLQTQSATVFQVWQRQLLSVWVQGCPGFQGLFDGGDSA